MCCTKNACRTYALTTVFRCVTHIPAVCCIVFQFSRSVLHKKRADLFMSINQTSASCFNKYLLNETHNNMYLVFIEKNNNFVNSEQ